MRSAVCLCMLKGYRAQARACWQRHGQAELQTVAIAPSKREFGARCDQAAGWQYALMMQLLPPDHVLELNTA